MKKCIIVIITIVLYAVLLAVTWHVGTRQARARTEAMLDYAVSDIRVTMDGAIDTMLEHVAVTCVRHLGKASARPMKDIVAIAEAFDIDELNGVDRTGRIYCEDPTPPDVVTDRPDEDAVAWILQNG